MRKLRQTSQILFLVLFLALLIKTTYPLSFGNFSNIFTRFSPLLSISVLIFNIKLISNFFPALFILIITILFGRVFCGFICPFGTTFDIFDRFLNIFLKKNKMQFIILNFKYKKIKYFLLFFIFFFTIFSLPLAGIFDPISLALKFFSFIFLPSIYYFINFLFYISGKNETTYSIILPFFNYLKESGIMPPVQPFYIANMFFLLLFLLLFSLSIFQKRFWCKNLCPLGAIFALFSRFSIYKRGRNNNCTSCSLCEKNCKAEAIYNSGENTLQDECLQCFNCSSICPYNAVVYSPQIIKKSENENIKYFKPLSRREFILGIVSGVIFLPILKLNQRVKFSMGRIIRPPGALNKDEFVLSCIRCGECMKVCPTNGLQPVMFEEGINSFWTPKLVPRIGYCEYNCTLCGEVCPSGAIKKLTLDEKKKFVIGIAYFDKNRCIPWAEGQDCLVCEEMCPTSKKAIQLKETKVYSANFGYKYVKLPYVVEELCIGCGICENKCPLLAPAIYVVREELTP